MNYSIFPILDVKKRLKRNDHFFTSLLKEPLLFILGQEHEFRRLAQEWLAQAA